MIKIKGVKYSSDGCCLKVPGFNKNIDTTLKWNNTRNLSIVLLFINGIKMEVGYNSEFIANNLNKIFKVDVSKTIEILDFEHNYEKGSTDKINYEIKEYKIELIEQLVKYIREYRE